MLTNINNAFYVFCKSKVYKDINKYIINHIYTKVGIVKL